MKSLTLGLAFALLASQASAQQTLIGASPIPVGAESAGSVITTAWRIRRTPMS